jgi:hypothetical protein
LDIKGIIIAMIARLTSSSGSSTSLILSGEGPPGSIYENSRRTSAHEIRLRITQTQRLIDERATMVGRKPMRRRRSERAPPRPASSFGATARPTSPRSSTSTPASAADLDELLLTAPPPLASEPRSFPYAVKQQCWEKAEKVPGHDSERWRRDALGNIVFRKLVGCPGCLCHDYDHIVPYSKVTLGRNSLTSGQW